MRLLFLTCALLIASVAPAAPLLKRTPANDRETLLALERAWDMAIVKRDTKALDQIIADDFQLIWINGQVTGKRQLIEGVTKRKAEIDPFETEDVKVRVYGDTAILTGRFTQTVRLGDQHETNQFRYTDVYHRTKRGWQAVSAHASLIKP